MPVLRNDVVDALDSALLELMPAAMEGNDPGASRLLFTPMQDGRSSISLSSLHAAGRLQKFRNGEDIPEENVFSGAKVTIVPVALGAERSFSFQTVAEVEAAKNGDLRILAENWALSQETTRDVQCAELLRNNGTIYDATTLFSTTHPQMSKTAAGDSYANTITAAAAVSADAVRALLKLIKQTSARGENGERITPKVTHIVATDFDDYNDLVVVLQSTQRAGTANNDVNSLSRYGIQPVEWYELAELSGTTRYMYAFTARPGQNGLVYVEKSAFSIVTYMHEKSRTYKTNCAMEGAPACINWRSVARAKTKA